MTTSVVFTPHARNFFKKLKDQKLKALYQKAIDQIALDHTVGKMKTGNLSGIYGYDIYYNKTNYELAYTVRYEENKIIIIRMAGTRETLDDKLSRYLKNKFSFYHMLVQKTR